MNTLLELKVIRSIARIHADCKLSTRVDYWVREGKVLLGTK